MVDDQPAGQGAAGAGLRVRAASWNTLYTNPTAGVVAGIKAIGADADVIGLQELNSATKRRQVARASAPSGPCPTGGTENTTPIVWRRSVFDLLGSGPSSPPVWSGSNPARPAACRAAVDQLGPVAAEDHRRRRRRRQHPFHSDDRPRRPPGPVPAGPAPGLRPGDGPSAGAGRQVEGGGPVVGTMDANIDARRDAQHRNPRWPYVADGTARRVVELAGARRPVRRHPRHPADRLRVVHHHHDQPDRPTDPRQLRLGPLGRRVTLTTGPPPHTPALTAGLQNGAGAATGALPAKFTVPGGQPGSTLTLTGEQVSNAAVVIAEGKSDRIPMLGWVVALAAALQESGIRNLAYGDRDSQGMFQQRPSSGWGTPAQIRDPHLATQAFYGVADHTHNPGLTDIHGWQDMPVAPAAQAVQRLRLPRRLREMGTRRPGHRRTPRRHHRPRRGDRRAGPARTGSTPNGLSAPARRPGCRSSTGSPPTRCWCCAAARPQFPQLATFYGIGNRPANTDDDHQTGRAVDLMIPDYATPAGSALGWQVADWMRAHHAELGVHYVIFAAKIWNLDRDAEGWRDYTSITGSNDRHLPALRPRPRLRLRQPGHRTRRRRPISSCRPGRGRCRCRRAPTGSAAGSAATRATPGRTSPPRPAPVLRSSDDGIVIRSEALRTRRPVPQLRQPDRGRRRRRSEHRRSGTPTCPGVTSPSGRRSGPGRRSAPPATPATSSRSDPAARTCTTRSASTAAPPTPSEYCPTTRSTVERPRSLGQSIDRTRLDDHGAIRPSLTARCSPWPRTA